MRKHQTWRFDCSN